MTSVVVPFAAIAFTVSHASLGIEFSGNPFRLVGHENQKKQNRSYDRRLEEIHCVNALDANDSLLNKEARANFVHSQQLTRNCRVAPKNHASPRRPLISVSNSTSRDGGGSLAGSSSCLR